MIGIVGGIILIPCESFIQVRPAPERKGRLLATANLLSFIGVFVASAMHYVFTELGGLKPGGVFLAGGIDGMSVLFPAGDPQYYSMRPNIANRRGGKSPRCSPRICSSASQPAACTLPRRFFVRPNWRCSSLACWHWPWRRSSSSTRCG